ncbi:unnamed protein product [Phytomonas sp. EM1]|nr:unnamed protein product [Phytomonas sp. EM1]|eukprot:CCW65541.1 unnamed protein product [Phytomonas sp. isolate EM1]
MPSSHDNSSNADPTGASRYRKNMLHDSFSAAAVALTKLYQESSNAYEDGYRDALLYVHRCVLLTSRASSGMLNSGEAFVSPDSTVASQKLLNFIQKTLKLRKERVACARGTAEGRCRPRDHSLVGEEDSLSPSIAPTQPLPTFSESPTLWNSEQNTTAEGVSAEVETNRSSDAQPSSALLNLREAHAYDIAEIDHARSDGLPPSTVDHPRRPSRAQEPPPTRPRYHSPVDYHRK